MATPFLGEVKIISWGYAPKYWALADGTLLPISQFANLYSLYGTTFGGDGRTSFGIPNLNNGRVPIGSSPDYPQGTAGGEKQHTLNHPEMPRHTHQLVGTTTQGGNAPAPDKRPAGSSPGNLYGAPNNLVAMNYDAITTEGLTGPHENMMPYTGLTFIVALQGVYPSPTVAETSDEEAGDE